MSSRIRSTGRNGPLAKRAWIRHVPVLRSSRIGPRNELPPNRRSPCPVRSQPSSAATHVWNGMSTIRLNDSRPRTGTISALMLALTAWLAGAATAGGSGTVKDPIGPLKWWPRGHLIFALSSGP